MKPPSRILLVKPSSMGDVIHSLPVVSAIHNYWPEAELRWLILPVLRFLVEEHPGVSGTVLFPRESFRGPAGWLRSIVWLRTLSDWKPDLAIDLQGLMRSALFARFSGAATIIGLGDAREGARLFYQQNASVRSGVHAVNRYLDVLNILEIPRPQETEFLLPKGRFPIGFDATTPYLVLHPFSRGAGKSLHHDLIRAFARGVGSRRLILVGRGSCVGGLPSNVEDWTNATDLAELLAIIRGARFSVSSDSGPMHLSAAVNPSGTLSIHLWSDPLKVGPHGGVSWVWKNGRISTVSALDDSWRAPGRPPSENEMEELGLWVALQGNKAG